MKKTAVVILGSLVIALFAVGAPQDASAGFLDKLKAATGALKNVGKSVEQSVQQQDQPENAQQQNAQQESPEQRKTQQPTSANAHCGALGAGCLNALDPFAKCQEKMYGYQERVIAGRLEKKLARSPQLNAKERAVWQADIVALRAVTYEHQYQPPDRKQPLQYLAGLTEQEQIAATSMNARNRQQVFIKCEQEQPNGLSSPADEQRYIASLRAKMPQATDISTLPLEALPSPFPKSEAELEKERAAADQARRADTQQKMAKCLTGAKGLRLEVMADRLQQKLDDSHGLSAKERADFVADIKAARVAAAEGLYQPKPVDPKNPGRVMMRLNEDDQLAINAEFQKKYVAYLQQCTR